VREDGVVVVTEQQTWAALGVLCATLLASMTMVSTLFVRFINAKFQIVETKFEAMDAKFEAKFEAMDAKFDAVNTALANLDRDVQMLVRREMDR